MISGFIEKITNDRGVINKNKVLKNPTGWSVSFLFSNKWQ